MVTFPFLLMIMLSTLGGSIIKHCCQLFSVHLLCTYHSFLSCSSLLFFCCTDFLHISISFLIIICNVRCELGNFKWKRWEDARFPKLCSSTVAWQTNCVLYITSHSTCSSTLSSTLEHEILHLDLRVLPFRHFCRSSEWARFLYSCSCLAFFALSINIIFENGIMNNC